MKIVHVITGLNIGGAERMLLKLIGALRERYVLHVVSLTNKVQLANEIESLGVPVRSVGFERRVSTTCRAFVRLVRLLRELRPDVVQTWMYHADLIGGLAARCAKVKAVSWNVRNSDLSSQTRPTTRAVVRVSASLSAWLPSAIVCCSENARALHVQQGYDAKKFVVIPNGFALDRFKPDEEARASVRKEIGIPVDAPLIGLIARFDPQKDHQMFLAAARELRRMLPTVHFLMVGTNIAHDNRVLRQWIEEAGVADVTHLLGERDDIPRLTAALDVATCCSAWGEAFPNVLGEALACGVPCVTTDVGDAAVLVGDVGYVVPRHDWRALSVAWSRLLMQPAEERERMGRRGRERVATDFDIHAVANRYAELYESLVARGSHVRTVDSM